MVERERGSLEARGALLAGVAIEAERIARAGADPRKHGTAVPWVERRDGGARRPRERYVPPGVEGLLATASRNARVSSFKPLHARSLLRRLLPPAVSRRLAWPTIRVEPGTYVDPRLVKTASDVLLSVRLRGSSQRALVFLLFDHQADVDPMMPLRMLGYAFQAWSDYVSRADAVRRYLPPLIPIRAPHAPRRSAPPRVT